MRSNVVSSDSSPQKQFKKRPLVAMMAIALTLAGQGAISSQVHAQEIPASTLCSAGTVTNSELVTSDAQINNDCHITNPNGAISVIGSTLTNTLTDISLNTSPNTLTNDGLIEIGDALNSGGGLLPPGFTSRLVNEGSLINKNTVLNASINAGTSELINAGTLTNSSYGQSELPLPIPGSLIANVAGPDGTSKIHNQAGANLNNGGMLVNANLAPYFGEGFEEELEQPSSAGAFLHNEGTLTNSGVLTNGLYALYATALAGPGPIPGSEPIPGPEGLFDYNSQIVNTGALTNTGLIVNSGLIYNGGTIVNNGSINLLEGSVLVNYPPRQDARPLVDDALPLVGSLTQLSGETIVNGAIYGGTVDIQGGTLSGSGYIDADVTIGENASVKPGNSPGTLILAGDVDLLGTLDTEIESSTVYDVLAIGGTVSLADTTHFNFMFDNTYTAVAGDSFDFLTAFNFDFGSFDLFDKSNFTVSNLMAGFGWDISFTDNFTGRQTDTDSFLSLNLFALNPQAPSNDVSTPTTITMFGLALSMIGLNARRKRKLNR